MCCKTLNQLLKSPLDAINRAKREKNMGKTIWILILTWFLIGASFLIVSLKMFTALISIGVGITFFLLGVLCSIFCGYIIVIIMNVLGGRGKYFEGLTVMTYSSFPISVGIFITALLTLIHPMLGFIGFIIIAVKTALSLSIYFRSVKVLFGTDMLTAFIGFLIILYVFMISLYLTVIMSSTAISPFLSNIVSTMS
jgi:hypothetical protein